MDGKFGKLTALSLALIFMAGAMLVFVPTASAQQSVCTGGVPVDATINVAMTSPDEAVRPITGSGKVTVSVTYTVPPAGFSLTPITLSVTANAQENWATVVLDKSTESIQVDANQESFTNTYTFPGTLFFTKDAPAFARTKVTADATSTAGTCITDGAAQVPGETIAQAGFYGKMQARLDKTIVKAGQNAQVTLPLIVQNFGNGELLTKYEVVTVGDKETPLDVVLPGNIIIPSSVGTTLEPVANLNIDINTPYKNGYENRIDSLTIRVTSVSNEEAEIVGPEAQVTALIRTQGVYVPGFEVVTMLAAAFVAIAGAIRKRD